VRAVGALNLTSPSTRESSFTSTPSDLGFFLNGVFLPNNSIVLLSNIGVGSGALFCLTNVAECCTEVNNSLWKFPNNTEVMEESSSDIYMTRSFSSSILSRKNGAVGPMGVYSCMIPDSNSIRSLSIGIYNNKIEAINIITGNGVLHLGTFSGISCSTEVPVQFIQWLNESDSMMIHNNRTLVQKLELNFTINAFHNNTRYTCTISTDNGFRASKNITITTEAIPEITVKVLGNESIAMQDFSLMCVVSVAERLGSSITYSWSRGDSMESLNETSMEYTFTPTTKDDGVAYYCNATVNSGLLLEPITVMGSSNISVLGGFYGNIL
jgi:hypothetical protein